MLSECSRCKAMFDGDNTGLQEDDEMLISFDDEDDQLKLKKIKSHHQHEITSLRQRVAHVEGLLSANLDTLNQQQKYYEGEVQKWQLQAKRMQSTVESYEKQSARDKMIIKFREERIGKLEQIVNQQPVDEEQARLIGDLRKEVLMWKEAADHNTQAAKLFAEK